MSLDNLDDIAVSYGSLHNASEGIKKNAERLRGDMEVLQSELKSVVESWEGEAQQAYARVQTNWDKQADELFNVMLKIAAQVNQASDDYRHTDLKGRSYFDI
ncbi:WXG100 family type VII secretion target [Streptomyces sp. NPDC053560]|uniref:WXG100 family type VII secretion target n=1 Tax=Streptomyces sp. NPDC053560 TaxID=3365711 RepID=UPI0037D6DCDE